MPIRSPLGALGAILVGLEGVAGATLFALDSDPHLRSIMAYTIIGGFILITSTVLILVCYFAKTNPGFLFNPADVGQLSESVQQRIFRIQDDVPLKIDHTFEFSTDDAPLIAFVTPVMRKDDEDV